MAWQKKHKKRPFPGKRKVNNTSEAVMYVGIRVYVNGCKRARGYY